MVALSRLETLDVAGVAAQEERQHVTDQTGDVASAGQAGGALGARRQQVVVLAQGNGEASHPDVDVHPRPEEAGDDLAVPHHAVPQRAVGGCGQHVVHAGGRDHTTRRSSRDVTGVEPMLGLVLHQDADQLVLGVRQEQADHLGAHAPRVADSDLHDTSISRRGVRQRGSRRTCWARMFFMTSVVPPAIVVAREPRAPVRAP